MRIILCGFGVVGQSLVKLFDSRSEELYAKYGLKPRVVGVFDSKGSAVNESGLSLSKLVEVKKKFGTVKNYSDTKNSMSGIEMLKNIEADVLIETTASNYKDAEPGMMHIISAMKKGMHVISVNKGPLALASPSLMEPTPSAMVNAGGSPTENINEHYYDGSILPPIRDCGDDNYSDEIIPIGGPFFFYFGLRTFKQPYLTFFFL